MKKNRADWLDNLNDDAENEVERGYGRREMDDDFEREEEESEVKELLWRIADRYGED